MPTADGRGFYSCHSKPFDKYDAELGEWKTSIEWFDLKYGYTTLEKCQAGKGVWVV